MWAIGALKTASRPVCRPSSFSRGLHPTLPVRSISQNTNGQIAQLLDWKPESDAKNVTINGYVRSSRNSKEVRFINIGDGSSSNPLQAVVPRDLAQGLSVGTAVCLTGSWVPSPGNKQSHELHAEKCEVVGPSDSKTYPIQKKYHTPEFLRTVPHLRSRTTLNSSLLRLRSHTIASLTNFFASQNFTQTHPPMLTSSDCEGAGEVFKVIPATEEPSAPNKTGKKSQFFGSTKYLTVSTQLHLEALAQSVGNVWTLSPVFRAEKSDTPRHLSEFYMLEAEMTFVDDLSHVMNLAEDMIRSLSKDLFGSPVVQELLARNDREENGFASNDEVRRRWEGLMQPSWPRITYTDAISLLQQNADLFECKPTWSGGLQTEHEKFLAGHVGGGTKPVFVVNYPRDIKAFYMRASEPAASPNHVDSIANSSPGATVDCFDLLVPELCEIAGGSMREHRLEPLLAAMKQQGLVNQPGTDGKSSKSGNSTPLEWYTDLRRWGCPPHGGFGVGFDRLLCYLSGVPTVRDIVAFPRWFGRCDC